MHAPLSTSLRLYGFRATEIFPGQRAFGARGVLITPEWMFLPQTLEGSKGFFDKRPTVSRKHHSASITLWKFQESRLRSRLRQCIYMSLVKCRRLTLQNVSNRPLCFSFFSLWKTCRAWGLAIFDDLYHIQVDAYFFSTQNSNCTKAAGKRWRRKFSSVRAIVHFFHGYTLRMTFALMK